jgi:hypothetical protein
MVTQEGQPVELFLTHGGFSDVDALKYYTYDLPEGSIIFADKAYNDYEIEDLLKAIDRIHLTRIIHASLFQRPSCPKTRTHIGHEVRNVRFPRSIRLA